MTLKSLKSLVTVGRLVSLLRFVRLTVYADLDKPLAVNLTMENIQRLASD